MQLLGRFGILEAAVKKGPLYLGIWTYIQENLEDCLLSAFDKLDSNQLVLFFILVITKVHDLHVPPFNHQVSDDTGRPASQGFLKVNQNWVNSLPDTLEKLTKETESFMGTAKPLDAMLKQFNHLYQEVESLEIILLECKGSWTPFGPRVEL